MPLQMYYGCSGSGKSHNLYKHIIDESLAHPELTYLILVPEQYNLSTQRRLISMHPKHGILNIDVLSFSRLAHRVFEEVGYSKAKGVTIDDIGKNLILRHLAGMHEDKLSALAGVYDKPGYISEVKSVISEFMQYGIGDNELGRLIEKSNDRGILKSKLTDIRFLYAEFLRFINEKYITTEEILQKVTEAVPRSKKLKNSIIVLDGYTGFTPVQLRVIEALLVNCVGVYVSLLIDPLEIDKPGEAGKEELFYLSRKTMSSLDKLCRDNKVERKEDIVIDDEVPARFRLDVKGRELEEDKRCRELIHLEHNLFRVNPEKCPSGSGIRIFKAADPYDEAVETAVRIEQLIREEGYRYSDIAVVSGDISTYMNACARAFSKYDIPFFVDKTIPVLLNPMIEYIRSAFEVLINDFSYETMFRFLRVSVSGVGAEETDRLENYILKYGIRGREQWNSPFVKKPKGMEADELGELNMIRERSVHDLNLLYDEIFAGGHSDREIDVRIISTALYHFMTENDLQEKMRQLAESFDEQGDPVRSGEYGRIYEEVCLLLDKMVSLMPGEAMTLDEYAGLLDAGFAEIRTGVIPETDDHVQIGDITRTRLNDIKALFFVGVNDGIIPMSPVNGGIISEMEREFLADNDLGIELAPTARMQAYTQRLYLYMLVTKPSERLYLSYSTLSPDGESINPSYFINTIADMFTGILVEARDDGIENRVYGLKTGYDSLAAGLSEHMSSAGEGSGNGFLSLFGIYAFDPVYRDRLGFMLDRVFEQGIFAGKDEISKAVADVLYGRDLTCSITRLENYARCAYSHFLKYGLSLKERELFSFEAKDMGSVFHDTLQNYAEILKEKGLTWIETEGELSESIIDEAIERCVKNEDYDALYGSFRTKYTIERIRRITRRTVDTLTYQLNKGRFIPYKFELGFSSGDDDTAINISLSGEEKMRIIGRIDRVDICDDGSNVYVKVIDYKSGNKSFDLEAVYAGLELQLTVYLNAAMGYVSDRYKDRKAVPAGILYYHIDDPVIEDDSDIPPGDDKINASIRKQLRMNGLVNSDDTIYRLMDTDFSERSEIIPVSVKKDGDLGSGSSVASTGEFRQISERVNKVLVNIGREIKNGNIKAEPYVRKEGDISPCTYCDYSDICGYRGEPYIKRAPDDV